jgi:multidrug transporter EmrE-like cation transporter
MSPYIRFMTIAFLTNGLGAFGLRVLAGNGLGTISEIQYLTLWYVLGFVTALVAYMKVSQRPIGKEVLIGSGMAVSSLCGQLGMALSLSGGIPGFIVFPVATGGGMLFVVAVGRLVYHEPMGALGILGILVGLVAMILLALPG